MKHPVFGLEKPYFEQIGREIIIYTDDTCFDGFSNMVAVKKQEKKIVVAFSASENAFLVNKINSDGTAGISPLYDIAETLSNERVLSPTGKQGLLDAKNKTVDFLVADEKAAEKVVQPGDVIYLKPTCETLGDSYITNQIPYFLKQIFTDYIKHGVAKISVAFLREKQKGAHA